MEHPLLTTYRFRVQPLLAAIYPPDKIEELLETIFAKLQPLLRNSADEDVNKWSQDDVLLITYGNSLIQEGQVPLQTLGQFLDRFLQTVITGVHILPFFPYTSDDGFAVSDYRTVRPALGDWGDIEAIAQNFKLMVDLVINHVSSEHEWFQQFKAGQAPGKAYFIALDPHTDVSQVVRPRSSPLLAPVETNSGTQYVWSTFSHDQHDVNFANPEVLLEYLDILLLYIQKGARLIRLDAIAYLWKELGTPCIHLPQTHALVRLLRELIQLIDPGMAILTETNVPNRENLSYFGSRNEAHMIYNFSLPPLLLNALIQGKSDHLKTWMMSMPPAPVGCAYLNFTASHDGIGVRPAEGLLSPAEFQQLITCMQQFGGAISLRRHPDGSESPYELNISFYDALQGTVKGKDHWQQDRFLCAQTLMMSLEGIPAFYIHSLLATPNDYEGMARTQHNRSINRRQWNMEDLEPLLADPRSIPAMVLGELSRRIKIRRRQGAFHPNATQYTLHPMNRAIFAFWRQSIPRDQSIFCIFNLSARSQQLNLSALNLVVTDPWCDLISGQCVQDIYDVLHLKPYQCVWLSNQFSDAHVDQP